jgi:hypothetical protein
VFLARLFLCLKNLEETGSQRQFYGGYVCLDQRTVHDPTSKWFLAKEQFDEKYWPPFCHGAFHILSTDILPHYFNYTKYCRKPFHTEDAYFRCCGERLGSCSYSIPGFNLQFIVKPRSDCELLSSIAMGHKINASTMIRYYRFYTTKSQTTKEMSTCLASGLNYSSTMFILSIFVLGNIITWKYYYLNILLKQQVVVKKKSVSNGA